MSNLVLSNSCTQRLQLQILSVEDAPFIYELVNTEGWLRFIGDRHVHSLVDAIAYISRISSMPNLIYWVVKELQSGTALGIISFMKRSYLAYPDLGFAFLPAAQGKGYAFEAAKLVLEQGQQLHATILATTFADNHASISLLNRLGFWRAKSIEPDGILLDLYAFGKSMELAPLHNNTNDAGTT